jgi:lipoprotein-releasing system permease protein
MSYSTFIARRYLQSRQNDGFVSFITSIAILGVTLGTAALIISLSVLGGFEREITDKVIGFTSHVQVFGYQNQPLRNYEHNTSLIADSIPAVRAVAPFASREALIRSKETVDGILLKGVDPERDVTATAKFIVEGGYDVDREAGSLPRLVIGRKLASKLALGLGDKATVFATTRMMNQGQMRAMQFTVTGIYESGMSDYDDLYAFTALHDAQALFQFGDAVTGYDILVRRVDSAEVVADRIQDLLGYPHYARTVYQSYRNVFSWIELQKKPVPIILGLIIVVATVNIIGTLLMIVLGKMKEIGILMSLGATRWGVTKIFLRQGLTIAVVGTLLGNALAFGICYLQMELKFFSLPSEIYFMSSVPILLRWEYFIIVSIISVVLCLLSSVVPARLASRLNPVNAIRFA